MNHWWIHIYFPLSSINICTNIYIWRYIYIFFVNSLLPCYPHKWSIIHLEILYFTCEEITCKKRTGWQDISSKEKLQEKMSEENKNKKLRNLTFDIRNHFDWYVCILVLLQSVDPSYKTLSCYTKIQNFSKCATN